MTKFPHAKNRKHNYYDEIFKAETTVDKMNIPQGEDDSNVIVTVGLDYPHVCR